MKKLMAEKQNIIVAQHASNMPRIGGSSCSTDTQQETTAKHQLHNEGEQNVRILRPRSELPAGSDKEDECHRLAHGYCGVGVFAVERYADEVEQNSGAVKEQNNLHGSERETQCALEIEMQFKCNN